MTGIYIILEGIVGTGKTTQAKLLFEYLKSKYPKKDIILTREPGGTQISESIRKLVQATKFDEEMEPICEAYLYASARAQSLRKIVKPVLEKGGIVISDRSFISSVAYQGFARKLGVKKIMEINKIAIENITPNVVLYFDMDPKIGLERTFDETGDKFESEKVEFFKKIEQGYKEISKLDEFKDKWINIDASGDIKTVFNRIIDLTKPYFIIF